MFRITEDPSSGSLVQCLAKNYKNYSITWFLSHMKVVVCYVNVCIMQLQITLCGGRYVDVLVYWEAKENKFQ